MIVDKKLIEHVAKVARLNLTNEEIIEFLPQLKEILLAFEELQEIDTTNILPSYHPVEVKNHTREDKILKSFTQKQALSNSINNKGGYFMGPKVI